MFSHIVSKLIFSVKLAYPHQRSSKIEYIVDLLQRFAIFLEMAGQTFFQVQDNAICK